MTTMEQIESILTAEEPAYDEAGQLDRAALDYLHGVVLNGDPLTASKAVYLASMTRDERSEELLFDAARSPESVVRIAAAGASSRMRPKSRNAVLLALVDDSDYGVRKTALDSVPNRASQQLKAKVYRLSHEASDTGTRKLAASVLQRLGRK
jgi:HEAT repeat protein